MATRLRSFCLLLSVIGASVLPLSAQEMVSVRVFTEPSGPRFTVDGLQYIAPQTFRWPVGSKHVVAIVAPNFIDLPSSVCTQVGESAFVQYEPGCESRYQFSAWDTTAGTPANSSSAIQVVTADKDLTFVRARFAVEHRVDVSFVERPGVADNQECLTLANYPGPPKDVTVGPGVVFVGGNCLDRSTSLWVSPGSLALQAIPFDRYVFRGWTFDNSPTAHAQISAIDVKGHMVISPRFEPGKRVFFLTEPVGLNLRIDNTVIHTIEPQTYTPTYPKPGLFDWVGGSQHIIGGVSPQVDVNNNTWVFHKWSNGGGQNMPITVDYETNVPLELTGHFVPGVPASLVTEPAGLKLNVEGRDNWPVLNFVWGMGLPYDVIAPAEQVDSRGRKYLFTSWSNGGPAAQKIVPEQSQVKTGIRMTAKFEVVPQVVVQSSTPGVKITVDGAVCTSPCRFDRPMGSVLNVSVPAEVPISEVSRLEFVGWSDGGSPTHELVVDSDTKTVVAMYRTANRLIVAADPGEGATFETAPSSPDGFYPSDTQVTIKAAAKPGFRFRRWDGDVTGSAEFGAVSMSRARVVRALLDRVPFIEPNGVRNAAANLAEPGVAPGLVAIYGGSLARTFEVGPSGPLSQSLGGTVVLVEDRILPLVYVSPEQINAQLPGDLEPGEYNVTVRTQGMADVTSTFAVVRNAPGLFSNPVDGIAYAAALHEDGSAISAASPAKRTETITLLGTGFGPYNRRVLDGFVTPAAPAATVVDPIQVVANGVTLRPTFAGAAPGLVGLTATRLRLDGTGPGPLELKVVVNGKESNTVILPVE